LVPTRRHLVLPVKTKRYFRAAKVLFAASLNQGASGAHQGARKEHRLE